MGATKKIEQLTLEQERQWVDWCDHWLNKVGLCCDPADFETGEDVLRGFYERLGKPAPLFLRFSSPLMCELATNLIMKSEHQLGSQLHGQLRDQLSSQLSSQLHSQLDGQLRDQLHSQLSSQLHSQLDGQLRDQLHSQLSSQLNNQLDNRLYGQLYDQLDGQLRNQLYDQLHGQLRNRLYGQLHDQLGSQLRNQLNNRLYDQLYGQLDDQLGSQLRNQLYGQLDDQLGSQLRNQLYDQLHGRLRVQLYGQLSDQLHDQLDGQIHDQLDGQIRDQLGGQIRDQIRDQIRNQLDNLEMIFLKNRWGGQYWCYWEAFYLYCESIGVRYAEHDSQLLREWGRLASAVNWWAAWERIAIISDRPREVHFDQGRRLHNDKGMAVRYSDGWGLYSWHGYRIPDTHTWVITDKDRITTDAILNEKNAEMRRVMCEVSEWRPILDRATVISQDHDGNGHARRLLAIDLGERESVRVIEVENGSLEPDGSRRRFVLGTVMSSQTPHEAIAASYGLRPEAYCEAVRT
jgi:hypothetical protein